MPRGALQVLPFCESQAEVKQRALQLVVLQSEGARAEAALQVLLLAELQPEGARVEAMLQPRAEECGQRCRSLSCSLRARGPKQRKFMISRIPWPQALRHRSQQWLGRVAPAATLRQPWKSNGTERQHHSQLLEGERRHEPTAHPGIDERLRDDDGMRSESLCS